VTRPARRIWRPGQARDLTLGGTDQLAHPIALHCFGQVDKQQSTIMRGNRKAPAVRRGRGFEHASQLPASQPPWRVFDVLEVKYLDGILAIDVGYKRDPVVSNDDRPVPARLVG
jgi:hypothetical protein